MGRLRGVFFDLYGTLFLYDRMEAAWAAWLEAFRAGMAERGYRGDDAAFAAACDGFFSTPEPTPGEGESVLEARIRRLGAELGLELSVADAARIAARKVPAWQAHVPSDPEAESVLEELSRRGLRLAVVSNFDQPGHVSEALRAHGLDRYFEEVIVSAEVGVKKPDPRIFAIALERLRLDRDEVVHVGDTSDDVTGAIAAGIRPILIQRERHGDDPTVHDYRPTESTAAGRASPVRARRTAAASIARLTELTPLLAGPL